MFGFLFKRNKNAEKGSSSKQGRRYSKELINLNLSSNSSSSDQLLQPCWEELGASGGGNSNSSANSFSVSTNSLSPSMKDSSSGFVSIDHCSVTASNPSLTPTATGLTSPTTASSDGGGESCKVTGVTFDPIIVSTEEEEDPIEFIDEIDCDNLCNPRSEPTATTSTSTPTTKTTDGGGNHDSGFKISNDDTERQLKETERKAMVQLEGIRSKLISKETELSLLQADINMLASDRDDKAMEVQRLAAKLNMLQAENELALKRIHEFEIQLEDLRIKNSQLSEEVVKKSEQLKCLRQESLSKPYECEELNGKIKELEDKIKELELEKRDLTKNRDELEKEKGNQIKALQDALEDALEAKIKLQTKYDKELQDLQQSNSSLLDDFEWKLHEVEANCKKKLVEKEQQLQQKIEEAKLTSSTTFEAEKKELDQEREVIRLQLRQVEHLKAYEAEVIQLRGVTSEQQKSVRCAARQIEQLKGNEKFMQSEIMSLKLLLEKEKSHCQVITNSTQRRLEAQEMSVADQLQKQKADLNAKWEEKLRAECALVKVELAQLHAEETRIAVESMKAQKNGELFKAQESLNNTRKELAHEVAKLKDQMRVAESAHQQEIAKAITVIDRDNWELRRKMEKLSDIQMEEMDELKESHSEEMERLQKQYDNALVQLEKLEQKVAEYEKTSRSTDSFETEKDSGISAITADGSKSTFDRTGNEDSEVSSESEEEEEEESDDEAESEESDDEDVNANVNAQTRRKDPAILELREEVATLQDSIDTLTLNLVQNENDKNVTESKKNAKGTPNLLKENGGGDLGGDLTISEADQDNNTTSTSSSFKSTTENESSVVSDTDNESDVTPFFLIGVIPILSLIFFQSILVAFWTGWGLIVYRIFLEDRNLELKCRHHNIKKN